MFSRDTGGWQLGCGGRGRGPGFTCSARLMAALLPVRPLTSKASRAQGAFGCPNSRQQAGSCEVQHWGFLSPLGFTHPRPRGVFLPLPLLFVFVCVLIIRGLLACFPNPTLTFPSATEKGGIPPAGKQSKRPGRIPVLCTNPWGHDLCPRAKEEDGRMT